jgi:hypothetical protein
MESNRNTTKFLACCGIAFLLIIFLGVGLVGGYAGHDLIARLPVISNILGSSGSGSTSTNELFQPFWEAWRLVHDQYLVQPVDDEIMMQGAIRGMMDSKDIPVSARG